MSAAVYEQDNYFESSSFSKDTDEINLSEAGKKLEKVNESLEIGFESEPLYVRIHGIEARIYEDSFEAEVYPFMRDDEAASEFAEVISDIYGIETDFLLGDGFGGGG